MPRYSFGYRPWEYREPVPYVECPYHWSIQVFCAFFFVGVGSILLLLVIMGPAEFFKTYFNKGSDATTESAIELEQLLPIRIAALEYHNARRKEHQVEALELDNVLNRHVLFCAKEYAKADSLKDASFTCYGKKNGRDEENSYITRTSGKDLKTVTLDACKEWYEEVKNFNFKDPWDYHSYWNAKPFIQMVWKATTKMGIGVYNYEGRTVVVALYPWQDKSLAGRLSNNVFPKKDE